MAGWRSLSVALALLVAFCGAAQAQQRRLLQDQTLDACSLSAVAQEVPDASTILQVINAFNLLPDGLPPNVTIFLPSNAATDGLPGALSLPFTASYIVEAADALGPQLKQRLVSLIAYHICPDAPFSAAELHAQQDIFTALNDTALLVTQDTSGGTLLTDASGRQARVVGGPAPDVLAACDAAVYVLDAVLMPADELPQLPRTTVAQAQGMLGVASDSPPAPA
ncbi:hypothetical protein ABPG75_010991 [Micractinium tetrahymenae]